MQKISFSFLRTVSKQASSRIALALCAVVASAMVSAPASAAPAATNSFAASHPASHEPGADTAAAAHKDLIEWQPWSDEAFKLAAREKKLVILDLEAVWCHWCHVMDEKTYHDPAVVSEIKKDYIAIRVDQDSRPDISNRFEDYGWPATILFDGGGRVLARRSGYIEPADTLKMLKAFAADPTPGPSASDDNQVTYTAAGPMSKKMLALTEKVIKDNYDYKLGGWKASHKFMDTHLADYWLRESIRGNKAATGNLQQALDTQLQIQDPAWGGFYQYSAESDWKHSHFEKLIAIQTENLKIYASASLDPNLKKQKRESYLKVAQKTKSYIDTFLKSETGTYFVSQDADLIQGKHAEDFFKLDDKARRARGIPKVDKHVYTRENAWVITAMLTLYSSTLDAKLVTDAAATADWLMKNRKSGELYRHDEKDLAGPYLGDNAAMLEALVKLYTATGDRKWLAEASKLATALLAKFPQSEAKPGLLTTEDSKALPQFEENLRASSTLNLLSHFTGNKADEDAAKLIFRYLSSSQFEGGMYASGALLVLNDELANPPLHIVVSGGKQDAKAKELFETAVAFPSPYKITEWWDAKEGPLPNPDNSYPTLTRAAAFVCGEHRCSFPAFEPKDIAVRVKQLTGGK